MIIIIEKRTLSKRKKLLCIFIVFVGSFPNLSKYIRSKITGNIFMKKHFV